jgi:hypothetical protein
VWLHAGSFVAARATSTFGSLRSASRPTKSGERLPLRIPLRCPARIIWMLRARKGGSGCARKSVQSLWTQAKHRNGLEVGTAQHYAARSSVSSCPRRIRCVSPGSRGSPHRAAYWLDYSILILLVEWRSTEAGPVFAPNISVSTIATSWAWLTTIEPEVLAVPRK